MERSAIFRHNAGESEPKLPLNIGLEPIAISVGDIQITVVCPRDRPVVTPVSPTGLLVDDWTQSVPNHFLVPGQIDDVIALGVRCAFHYHSISIDTSSEILETLAIHVYGDVIRKSRQHQIGLTRSNRNRPGIRYACFRIYDFNDVFTVSYSEIPKLKHS